MAWSVIGDKLNRTRSGLNFASARPMELGIETED